MAWTILPFNAAIPVKQVCLGATFRKRAFYPPLLNMNVFPTTDTGELSCQAKLAESRRVYHELMMGGNVQMINHDGRTVQYRPTDVDKLLVYISRLEATCGDGASVNHTSNCCCQSCARTVGRARSVTWS